MRAIAPGSRVTVAATALVFANDLNVPAGATRIDWDVQTADIVVTFDGTTPTASFGHLLPSGTRGSWTVAEAKSVRAIRAGSTSGVIQLTYWGY